jgi:sugar phosphate isomerase/epimerase
MHQVLISLSSFGAAEVRRHGQLYFARLAREAGADGFEVRGELLVEAERELPALAAAGRGAALVFSSPEGLFDPHGGLDAMALQRGLVATRALGAPRLKMSIGGFRADSAAQLPQLAQAVGASGIELVIENDQTVAAGTLGALQSFFAAAERQQLSLRMTFDMGNWHWTGECPLEAAHALRPRVAYVHCKGVQRHARRWVAVPLADSAAPWRSVLRALPRALPCAIEYPLAGEDLLATTHAEIQHLRAALASLGNVG